MDYSLSHPAANGETVTQGHADYCAAHGHSTWTKDGQDVGLCSRCGEVTTPAPALQDNITVRYLSRSGVKESAVALLRWDYTVSPHVLHACNVAGEWLRIPTQHVIQIDRPDDSQAWQESSAGSAPTA